MRTTDADRGRRTIGGRIASDGSTQLGTGGFTSTREGSGNYRIRPFPRPRACLTVTATAASGGINTATVSGAITADSFLVITAPSVGGTNTDGYFDFQATLML